MNEKKISLLTISDVPLSNSGVGTQMRIIIESLLKTGKFKVISLGGAIKHESYQPFKVEGFGDDWIIYPVDGFGTQEQIRAMIKIHRIDQVLMMSDPRFFEFLFDIENEIRRLAPLIWYTVWDNWPTPDYNKPFWSSVDLAIPISKVTDEIISKVSPETKRIRVPHAVNPEIFKKLPDDVIQNFREENFNKLAPNNKNKFVFFWNNRNARRKMSGSLVYWFNEFLKKVGKDKACLLMHTNTKDENGQDLDALIGHLGLTNGEIMFSREQVPQEALSLMYNLADCTINISDAEGFGISTLESLSCSTPILVNKTGGLQEQITDGEKEFGIGIEPVSKAIIGSQQVPWIFEDRVCEKDVVDAMMKIYNMSPEERSELGKEGREHVENNFNYQKYCDKWVEIMLNCHEEHGSWETRKKYKNFYFKTL